MKQISGFWTVCFVMKWQSKRRHHRLDCGVEQEMDHVVSDYKVLSPFS